LKPTLKRNKDKYDYKEAKILIGNFCAYRERSHSEVRSRLYDYGLIKDDVEELMMEMLQLGYLNEERYARAFVRGKYLHNYWGRQKIIQHLKQKQVSEQNITLGLQEINDEDYLIRIRELLAKKQKEVKGANAYEIKSKLAAYLIRKGYESALVWDEIRRSY